MKVSELQNKKSNITVTTALDDGTIQVLRGEAFVDALQIDFPTPDRQGTWRISLRGTGEITVEIK